MVTSQNLQVAGEKASLGSQEQISSTENKPGVWQPCISSAGGSTSAGFSSQSLSVGNLCSSLTHSPIPIPAQMFHWDPGPTPPTQDTASQKTCQGSASPLELLKTTPTGYLRPGCKICHVISLLPFWESPGGCFALVVKSDLINLAYCISEGIPKLGSIQIRIKLRSSQNAYQWELCTWRSSLGLFPQQHSSGSMINIEEVVRA